MKQNGIQDVSTVPRFNPEKFKEQTMRNVVYGTFQKPRQFSYDDPDPYGFFPGRKGDCKWHLINWSDDLNDYTNCYAFACGWTVKDDIWSGIYQPGFLCGMEPDSLGMYLTAIISDLNAVGRRVFEVHDFSTCPKKLPKPGKDCYWIKLLFADDEHFHMMRKDELTGKWIHKTGWTERPKVVLKLKLSDGKVETKYENQDRTNYYSYDKTAGTFIEYKFAYVMRIQK